MRLRRAALVLGVAGAALGLAHCQLPELAAWKLRRELAARGFPDARFRVVAVELDRLVLADVTLAPGLALGDVELDAGISLLWRDPEVVAIRGARIRAGDVTRMPAGGTGAPPVREVRIANSVLELEGSSLAIAGTIELGDTTAAHLLASAATVRVHGEQVRDVRIAIAGDRACGSALVRGHVVRACTSSGWSSREATVAWNVDDSAHGQATVGWSPRWTIAGAGQLAIPAWSSGGLAIADASLDARITGTLDELEATGTLRARTARLDDVSLVDLEVPFAATVTDGAAELRPHAARARSLAGHVRGYAVRAVQLDTVEVPLIAVVREGAPRISQRGPVHLTAARAVIAGATLTDARASVDRAGVITWSARELATPTVRAIRPSGIAEGATLRWRATTIRVGDATIERPTGRIDRGQVTWSAETGQWHDLVVRSPSGVITNHGDHEVRAASARWGEVELARPTATASAHDVAWHAPELRLHGGVLRDVAGDVRLATGSHAVAWKTAHTGRVALGAGSFVLDHAADHWVITRGVVSAFGGRVSVLRAAAIDGPVELAAAGLKLDALLGVLSADAHGTGALDGRLVVRAGQLERIALASARGSFEVGERRWVDRALASIAAGHVAVPERVGGALADFGYRHLALELGPTPAGPALRIELKGAGRRVHQELDLVVNVRGLRDAARVLVRAREVL